MASPTSFAQGTSTAYTVRRRQRRSGSRRAAADGPDKATIRRTVVLISLLVGSFVVALGVIAFLAAG